jgi:hypothetical protein
MAKRTEQQQSDVQLISVEFKDADGKTIVKDLAVTGKVLAAIKSGMSQATKLESFWKDNADLIVEEFFGADPFPNMSPSDMLSEFRASAEVDTMYAIFQTRHPEWNRAQGLKAKAAADSKSDEGKTAGDAYASAIKTIRRTANNQALKVCRYYADAHGVSQASEEREQPGARQIIEAAIADWSARIATARGTFKLPAERVLLQAGVDALRAALLADTIRKVEGMPTSTLSLDKPVGRAAQAAAQQAGEVATLTPEQYAEAQA